jgi:hypothetical protein
MTDFAPGDGLLWEHRDGGFAAPTIVRPVVFRGLHDQTTATVSFGLDGDGEPRLLVAPLAELSRPQPPLQQEPPPVSPPPAEPDLSALRDALRRALLESAAANAGRQTAEEAAARAEKLMSNAHTKLRVQRETQAAAADALAASLRGGALPPPTPNAQPVQDAERAAALSEEVFRRLARELAEARGRQAALQIAVDQAAAAIVGALLSAEIARLGALEEFVCEMRAQLRAQSEWRTPASPDRPLPLSAAARAVLGNPPARVRDPVGWEAKAALREIRQSLTVGLFARLISGDADAEF